MRIAVMSDVHGFDLALERVIADVAAIGPFDEVVVAGDLCAVGPEPARTIDLLQRAGFTALLGNTDRDVIEAAISGKSDAATNYVLSRIGASGVDWLAGLPFARRIAAAGGQSDRDDLLVVHANPHDLDRKLRPEMSDQELRATIGATPAAAIAFGHHHVAYIRDLRPPLLVDVSAVGNPKDGDLRSRYGVLTWDESTRRWNAEVRYVDYPLAETAAQIESSNLPHPERVLQKLLAASY
ncbi:MAG TPA: metallophosphoesterase family protein [Thermomicrobiales bacterium]|nr:metallophosphoesterase family protein [Thermomicrobiales bacterium]